MIVNEDYSKLEYSFDGESNVSVPGNTTLSRLPDGAHNLTVFATDLAGNVGSETLVFTVANSEPFPATLAVAASGASAIAIAVGLLVYLRKRAHRNRANLRQENPA